MGEQGVGAGPGGPADDGGPGEQGPGRGRGAEAERDPILEMPPVPAYRTYTTPFCRLRRSCRGVFPAQDQEVGSSATRASQLYMGTDQAKLCALGQAGPCEPAKPADLGGGAGLGGPAGRGVWGAESWCSASTESRRASDGPYGIAGHADQGMQAVGAGPGRPWELRISPKLAGHFGGSWPPERVAQHWQREDG